MRVPETDDVNERHFRLLAEHAPVGVFEEDGNGRCVYVNRRWQEITGLTAAEAMGTGWRRLVDVADLAALDAQASDRPSTGPRSMRIRLRRPDGGRPWVSFTYAARPEPIDGMALHVGILEDITESVETTALAQRITHAIEATNDLVGLYDFDDGSIYLNEAARRFFGLGEHVGPDDVPLVAPSDVRGSWPDDIFPALERDGIWSGEITVPDHTGRPTPLSAVMTARLDADGRIVGVSSICRDISDRKDLEASLEHQSTHDPLTGLPNRVLLLDRLTVALERAERTGSQVGVLFLDLDRFKVVNDSLGHGLGDRVLLALAERLTGTVRPGDTVARFGGDEFVIVAEDLDEPDEAVALATRLASVLGEPVEVGATSIVVSVSIGIALGAPGVAAAALVRDADAAMYRAKARGGSQHLVFDAETRTHAVDRFDLEAALREAIATDQLEVHYQPKINLASGRIVGLEALIRWHHPTRGLLLPDQFLRIADEAHLLFDVGHWVIRHAVAALPRLDAARPAGSEPLYLCLNISQPELVDPRLVELLIAETGRHGIDPGHVDLELTEHALMEDIGSTADALQRLKAHGFKLAVDDFGTGFSSLAYLRHFPVDLLKIDRTFVERLGAEREVGGADPAIDAAIVTAITTLAESLGLGVVAEGVETAGQLAALRALGCTMAQGYFISRALPLDEALAIVAADPVW